MTPLERSFLQALLENLPSSTAFTLPTAASYDRIQDGIWACGTYACWGHDNREAAVRLTGPPGGHHFELRTIDGTANPHVAFATILGLGLIGIEKGFELEIEDVDEPAVNLSAEERKKRGIVARLQRSLGAARKVARNDKAINDVLAGPNDTDVMDIESSQFMGPAPRTAQAEIKPDGLLLYVAQAIYEPGTSPLSSWVPLAAPATDEMASVEQPSPLDVFER